MLNEEVAPKKKKVYAVRNQKGFLRLVHDKDEAETIARALTIQNEQEFYVVVR